MSDMHIRCLDDKGARWLTTGKIYKILKDEDNKEYIIDDDGDELKSPVSHVRLGARAMCGSEWELVDPVELVDPHEVDFQKRVEAMSIHRAALAMEGERFKEPEPEFDVMESIRRICR